MGIQEENRSRWRTTILRYKARLVAKGFTQKYGIEKESYSIVVRYSTMRTLLSLAVNLDMHVDYIDVKCFSQWLLNRNGAYGTERWV